MKQQDNNYLLKARIPFNVSCRSINATQKMGGARNAVKKWVNRILNKFTGKVAIIKSRISQFLSILRAPKITRCTKNFMLDKPSFEDGICLLILYRFDYTKTYS